MPTTPTLRKFAPERLGSYELLERIASGGMAEVYVARRLGAFGFSKKVALKRILPQHSPEPNFVAMFVDEARLTASLTHPNLVQVFDFGEQHGEFFMVMELVEGTTCGRLVRAAAAKGRTVPLDALLYIVLSVLRGLSHAHNATTEQGVPLGLVHRDVSPGNILLARDGSVKLTDFGIVRAYGVERRTEHGQLKGKLGYMSPEQVLGAEIDHRSDLFTLAIIMGEMLVGRPLFGTGQELEILFKIRDADTSMFTRYSQDVPDELRSITLRALAREPGDRFQSADEFAEALEEFARRRRIIPTAPQLAAVLEEYSLCTSTARSGEHVSLVRRQSTPRATEASRVQYVVEQANSVASPAMALATLIELIVSGKIAKSVRISRDGAPFVAAAELPELRRVVTSSSHRWSSPPRDLNAQNAGMVEVTSLLFSLAATRATGVVSGHEFSHQRKLFLVDGQLEFSASTDPRELLGQTLISERLCMPVEVDMALALAPRYGGRLGDALISLGVLRPAELYRALNQQLRARLRSLLLQREGRVSFTPATRCFEEALPNPLSLVEATARALREIASVDDLARPLSPVMDVLLSTPAQVVISPLMLRLNDTESLVLDHLYTRMHIAPVLRDLPRRGQARELDVLRVAFLALCSGILSAPGWITDRTTLNVKAAAAI